MVCMAETAACINNSEVLREKKAKKIDQLVMLNTRLRKLIKLPAGEKINLTLPLDLASAIQAGSKIILNFKPRAPSLIYLFSRVEI